MERVSLCLPFNGKSEKSRDINHSLNSNALDSCGLSAILKYRFTDWRPMNHTFKVQVVRRGIITLPKELREHNRIEEGDILTLIDLGDGVVVMSPKRLTAWMRLRTSLPRNGRLRGSRLIPCSSPYARCGQNMTPKNLRVFLDTSVVFAAVLSPTGGYAPAVPAR